MSLTVLARVAPVALALACTHARTAADAQQEERAATEAGSEAEPSGDEARGSGSDEAKREDTTDEKSGTDTPSSGSSGASAAAREGAGKDGKDGKERGDDASDPAAAKDIDVATAPEALLQPGAGDKVRQKLGLAEGSGSMTAALRRFQREHDLPATGVLDHETVEKLGLSPDEIFEK
jgi:Putative peptidoglycan binding domain